MITYSLFIYIEGRKWQSKEQKERKRGWDCWADKARTESEAINRQIWWGDDYSRLEIMCQTWSLHFHSGHQCLLIVCVGCAPVNQSWHITQTQNSTPETKCQPTYTQTHTFRNREHRVALDAELLQLHSLYITLYYCHLNTESGR